MSYYKHIIDCGQKDGDPCVKLENLLHMLAETYFKSLMEELVYLELWKEVEYPPEPPNVEWWDNLRQPLIKDRWNLMYLEFDEVVTAYYHNRNENDEDEDDMGLLDVLMAAHYGDVQTLHNRLEQDGDLAMTENSEGWGPIHEAVKAGSKEATMTLIKYGANVNALTDEPATPLDLAKYFHGDDSDLASYLISLGGVEADDQEL